MRKLKTLAGDRNMKKSCKGFTLIEMAIVIMIVGLLVASLTPLYGLYQKKQEIETTETNVTVAISAIGTFRAIYGRYPCPASMTQDRDDPTYGREDCTSARTIPPGGSTADEGIWVERSRRPAFAHQYPEGTARNEPPRVLVGALPFRNLNLDEKQAYDAYDHKIAYVVTENLTCDKCFTANGGGIDIINDEDTSILPAIGQAHFLVMSYGKDGAGGYAKNGQQVACAGSGLESDNCNYRDGATADATYRLPATSDTKGDEHFDDVLNYFTQDEIPVWQMSTNPNAPLAIHQKSVEDGLVAIRKSEEEIDQTGAATKGTIGGAVRASVDTEADEPDKTGKILINELCNAMSNECFRPELIAGKFVDPDEGGARTGGMRCPGDDTTGGTGEFMVGIEDGQPICDNAVTQECPANSILVGVNDDGSLDCQTPDPAPCNSFLVSMCDVIVTVEPGVHGETQTVHAGASQERTYECRNGSWFITNDVQGACNCTPGLVETTTASCVPGYTGTAVTTTTRTCPDGQLTDVTDVSACVCVTDQDFSTRPCPDGYTGSIRTVSTHSCPDGTWSPYVDVPGDTVANRCVCDDDNERKTTSCPGGLTGAGKVEERTVTCTPGGGVTYGPWVEVSNDCECVAGPPVVQPFPCPTGYTGSVMKSRTLQCPAGTWSAWTPISDTCEIIPPVVCNWERTSSGTGPSPFGVGANSSSGCDCGDSGPCFTRVGAGQFLNYGSCRCN